MSFVNLSLRPVRDFRLARVFSGFGYLTPMEGFITINISVHRKVWFRFRKKSNARNHVANAKNRRNLSHSSPTCRTGLKLFRWFDFLVSLFLSLSCSARLWVLSDSRKKRSSPPLAHSLLDAHIEPAGKRKIGIDPVSISILASVRSNILLHPPDTDPLEDGVPCLPEWADHTANALSLSLISSSATSKDSEMGSYY